MEDQQGTSPQSEKEEKWKLGNALNMDQKAFNTFASLCYQEFSKTRPHSALPEELVRRRCQERWQGLVEADRRPFYRMVKKEEDENENYREVEDMDEPSSNREDEEYKPAKKKYRKKGPKMPKKRDPKMPKMRDPNLPKRALTGFVLFCQEKRVKVKEEFPELRGKGGVIKELAHRWVVEMCNL